MPVPSFVLYFADLRDPRVKRRRQHCLMDILVIAFLAILCGGEGWEDMRRFGLAKKEWLRFRLGLSLVGGIPSDDTFRRVFTNLDPEAFGHAFRSWVETLKEATHGEVIALDGKKLRHSFDTACSQPAMHLVRAWATGQRLLLGAARVGEGTNEIPTVAALLSLLDLRGAIVTADAMHCQRSTAAQIIDQEGDYVLTVKANQEELLSDMEACFAYLGRHAAAAKEWKEAASGRSFSRFSQSDYGHGRNETRTAQAFTLAPEDPDWRDMQATWKGLRTLLRIERVRTEAGKQSQETVYFISSLPTEAKHLAKVVRSHWQIENSLHWVLDVQMGEDASRIRKDHAPENVALIRSVALNLLRGDKNKYGGVKARPKLAGWNNDYLIQLLV
jgi:predicted transposase YbfD/YdcC